MDSRGVRLGHLGLLDIDMWRDGVREKGSGATYHLKACEGRCGATNILLLNRWAACGPVFRFSHLCLSESWAHLPSDDTCLITFHLSCLLFSEEAQKANRAQQHATDVHTPIRRTALLILPSYGFVTAAPIWAPLCPNAPIQNSYVMVMATI